MNGSLLPTPRRNSLTSRHPQTSVIWSLSFSLVLPTTTPCCTHHVPDCRTQNSLILPSSSVSLHMPFLLSETLPSPVVEWLLYSFRATLSCHITQEAFLHAHPPALRCGWWGATDRAPTNPLSFSRRAPLHYTKMVSLSVSPTKLHRNCAFLLGASRSHTKPGNQVTRMDSDLFRPDVNFHL